MAKRQHKPSPAAVGLGVFGIILVGEMVVHRALNLNSSTGAILVALIGAAAAVALGRYGWKADAGADGAADNPVDAGAELDSVSGVLSLRNLTISMLESMAIAERYGRQLAVVKIDVDDFDVLQSRFGAGGIDATIKFLGDTLNNAVRVPDRVGRYAPHSFLLVLPETAASGALQIAERVRRLVAEEDIRAGGGERFSVTLSAGVANFRAGDDPQRLIDRTEFALGEARSRGGDCTIVSNASDSVSATTESDRST